VGENNLRCVGAADTRGLPALLAFAFARALLNRRRLQAGAKDSPAQIGQVLAELRLKDVLRELRAAV
jgi:hypothetical protein